MSIKIDTRIVDNEESLNQSFKNHANELTEKRVYWPSVQLHFFYSQSVSYFLISDTR
jgi:hypothetical protein